MKQIKWLWALYNAKKIWRRVGFSQRQAFVIELRPILEPGLRAAYPDALFIITMTDVKRALESVK